MYIHTLTVVCAIYKLIHISPPSTGVITDYYDCLLEHSVNKRLPYHLHLLGCLQNIPKALAQLVFFLKYLS